MYNSQGPAHHETGEVPYGISYTPSHKRCICYSCKQYIPKGDIRISVRIPSSTYDGNFDQWHHEHCFWKMVKTNEAMEVNERSMKDFDWLSFDDQAKITAEIDKLYPDLIEAARGQQKKVVMIDYIYDELHPCIICGEFPHKYDLILRAVGFNYCREFQYCHYWCLAWSGLFQGSATDFIDFEDLDDDAQAYLKSFFDKECARNIQNKLNNQNNTSRTDRNQAYGTHFAGGDGVTAKNKTERIRNAELMQQQNVNQCRIRRALMNMPPSYWLDALKMNDLIPPFTEAHKYVSSRSGTNSGEDDVVLLNFLTDCIQFGVPRDCGKCNTPANEKFVVFDTEDQTYKCSGHISSYTACTFAERNPYRRSFTVPSNMRMEMAEVRDIRTQNIRVYSSYIAAMPKLLIGQNSSMLNDNQFVAKSIENKSRKMQTLHVKNGCQVDGMALGHEHLHVYMEPDLRIPWQCMLSQTNLSLNKNLIFKAQLLEHDTCSRYFIFTCFGNVGTDNCNFNTRMLDDDLEMAKKEFENAFEERTGNKWKAYMDGSPFQKMPGKFSVIDLMVDVTMEDQRIEAPITDFTISQPVREIVHMMFDVKNMKNMLSSMDIDLTRLPLKNLSDRQINQAYKVLSELEEALKRGTPLSNEIYLDLTNRFFTLIPHDTGSGHPSIMNDLQVVKRKTEMLDTLRQVAQSYMIASQVQTPAGEKILANYATLKCKIEHLSTSSGDYQRVATYANNTFDGYYYGGGKLEIVNVYRIDREAEHSRTGGFNRVLLWHGSPISNFVGILSRGLKIAPPEAPVTGYSLGKGVYFADMLGKSLGYCRSSQKSDAFLLLAEVALGEVCQSNHHNFGNRKPHESIKYDCGRGPSMDDAFVDYSMHPQGVKIPLTKPVRNGANGYNEYVVFNEEQIRLRYMIRIRI
ncbi:hypothetical protein L596_012811 [Steinernema carpocapsae]|uniref:Poly [ADP-ribose] polymerase n=1 Tax=Steinernema carpocapsae TaxID=34508 RepID=A0A4V6A4W8_STECR|nr:hypothetical protein L596_012811 [Steinernema carpocapsae]